MGGFSFPQIFKGDRVSSPKQSPQGVHGIGPDFIRTMRYNPIGPLMAFSPEGDIMKYGTDL